MSRTRFLLRDLPKDVQRRRAIGVSEKMHGGIRWIVTMTEIESPEVAEKVEDFMVECLLRKITSLRPKE